MAETTTQWAKKTSEKDKTLNSVIAIAILLLAFAYREVKGILVNFFPQMSYI